MAHCQRLAAALLAGMVALLSIRAQLTWNGIDVRPAANRDAGLAYDEKRGVTILFGGEGDIIKGRDETWEWNGARWRQLLPAQSPVARSGHGMCYDALRDRIVLFGGFGFAPAGNLGDTWEWDGSSWLKMLPGVSPSPRYGHAMVYDAARRQVVLYGGFTSGGFAADTWLYDGVSWIQATTPVAPPGRPLASACYDSGRGRVVLFGGRAALSRNDTWEWDGLQWTQRDTSVAPSGREHAPMAYDRARGRCVLINSGAPADCWEWDGAVWTQQAPAHLPDPTQGTAIYDAARGVVLVYGYGTTLTKSQWVYPGNDWRSTAPPHPSTRHSTSLAFDSVGGGLVLFGGNAGNAETWRLAKETWTRLAPAASPPGRLGHALSHDRARDRVVLFGGANFVGSMGVTFGDLWEWDGTRWLQAQLPTLRPPSRYWGALAYDSTLGKHLLFGGAGDPLNNPALSDTWLWNGALWEAAAIGPSARYGAAMAYDEVNRRMLLFGGCTGTQPTFTFFSDTWSFDGTAWTRLTPATVPTARGFASMAFDEVRRRVRMFGGQGSQSGTDVFFQETWEWDGTDWKLTPTYPTPVGRAKAAMGFDRRTGGIVVYGGTGALDDTHELTSAYPPRSEAYGAGCLGSYGVLTLQPRLGTWPVLGGGYELVVSAMRASWPAFLSLGASRTQWLGIPLPFDLSGNGMPGCVMLASNEGLIYGFGDQNGRARFAFTVPTAPALLGSEVYFQSYTTDSLANALGWTSSNAVAARLGE